MSSEGFPVSSAIITQRSTIGPARRAPCQAAPAGIPRRHSGQPVIGPDVGEHRDAGCGTSSPADAISVVDALNQSMSTGHRARLARWRDFIVQHLPCCSGSAVRQFIGLRQFLDAQISQSELDRALMQRLHRAPNRPI
jgi:hypothetical protein